LLTRLRSAEADQEPFFDVALFAHRLLAERRHIAAIWCADDVQTICPDLDDIHSWEVLQVVGRNHRAEEGINWTTLEVMADRLFGSAPETNAGGGGRP
jgi:hypothetical protein